MKRYASEEEDRFRHYHDFDSDAEEKRWYSKYEGGEYEHAPLVEHHDREYYREAEPLDRFEFEWYTIAHPYYDEEPYYYGHHDDARILDDTYE